MPDKLLSQITAADIDTARERIRDALIELRDLRVSIGPAVGSGHGLVVKESDGRDLSPTGVAAMGELVEAVRRKAAAENPPDPGAAALWARIDMVRRSADLSLREVAGSTGVPFKTLFRTMQGRMPGTGDLAAIESWLAANGG